MNITPLISIVVPSYNQGHFIGETLQSLVDQAYPKLEVIIQDGGSKDDSIEIAKEYAARYPGIFKVFVEKDNGQAHAINMGFAKSSGVILAFLNSDDTLYPGCLDSVAKNIDPEAGRFVVFGRSLFTGEGSVYVGVEHPADYVSHFEHLAIWKRGFNTIPQPSVFWHRKVMTDCGGLNEKEGHVLDYDLFCRFSAKYRFHKVDELWSTYRMHPASKSASKSEQEVLDLSIAVSRRYWGPVWKPLYWRCAASCWIHDRHAFEQARHHARLAETALLQKRYLLMLRESFRTLSISPGMAWHRLIHPVLARIGLIALDQFCFGRKGCNDTSEIPAFPDKWVGPLFRTTINVPANGTLIECSLQHVSPANGHHSVIHPRLLINGHIEDQAIIKAAGPFVLKAKADKWQGNSCLVEIRIPEYFIPAVLSGGPDNRKLSAILSGIDLKRS